MLAEHLKALCKELDIDMPKEDKSQPYRVQIAGKTVEIADLDPGVSLRAQVCLCPEKRKEDLFLFLMRANLLGQGTGLTRIGLDESEKFLTLSLGLPYEVDYRTFRDRVEEFANQMIYWRDSVKQFEQEKSVL